jgi:predicted secreted protein
LDSHSFWGSTLAARVLQTAPRFDFESYRRTCRPCRENMTHFLEEYRELYKEDKELYHFHLVGLEVGSSSSFKQFKLPP